RPRRRRVFAGGRAVRTADGSTTVQGGELPRDAASGAVRGAGAAVASGGQGAGGPGDGLSEVSAQGAGPPLCQCRGAGRRPGTVSAWRAGAGAANGAAGAHLALVPPPSGAGGGSGDHPGDRGDRVRAGHAVPRSGSRGEEPGNRGEGEGRQGGQGEG